MFSPNFHVISLLYNDFIENSIKIHRMLFYQVLHLSIFQNINTTIGLSKAGSVALWGVFAVGKISKQWHCNNCKSDF